MHVFQETTEWKESNVRNNIYALDGRKMNMYGFLRAGTTEWKWFKNPIGFDARGRTFKKLPGQIQDNKVSKVVDQSPKLEDNRLTDTHKGTEMTSFNSLKAQFATLAGQYSDGLAADMLLEKYPEMETEIELIREGKDMPKQATGEVVSEAEFEIEFPETDPVVSAAVFDMLAQTATGEATVPEFTKATKKKAEKKVKAPVDIADQPEKSEKKVSKATLSYEIYCSAEDKSRKTITTIYVEQLGLTAAGASTYYQNARKKFNEQQA